MLQVCHILPGLNSRSETHACDCYGIREDFGHLVIGIGGIEYVWSIRKASSGCLPYVLVQGVYVTERLNVRIR